MAITSIWRIGGWLGKLVVYVENPKKTKNPAFYTSPELTPQQTQNLSNVIDYASNDNKTTHRDSSGILHQFVSEINCHPGTARDEMLEVKNQFGKEDGTVAYHGIQSFAPGEATPELAHEIGVRLAQQLWGDKYQVLVATHLDTLHSMTSSANNWLNSCLPKMNQSGMQLSHNNSTTPDRATQSGAVLRKNGGKMKKIV